MSLLNNHLKDKDKKKAGPAGTKAGFQTQSKVKANTKVANKATKLTGGSQRGS